ncbi:precorrin-4 C(11)-methyltransferase [Thermovorax subterraneus]|nr:precorrin-4 C(11)-methyltransferase [Thermovorax subterraneus]
MIYFIGAGPGDPELITVKGRKILSSCEVVIYAGSLVNPLVLKYAKSNARIYDSSRMDLDEIVEVMKDAHQRGMDVARLHTGDPSLYSAVREQAARLEELGIPYEIVPGVSSFCAASAALKRELTVPGVSQTVIITRIPGRTPVPENEDLQKLSAHRATLVLFLSAGNMEDAVGRIIGSYGPDAPAAVVYKASWEDEKVVRGKLKDIAVKAKNEGIEKTALLIVGNALGDNFELSKLYSPNFSQGYRGARK